MINLIKNGIKTKWIKNIMDEPLDLSKKRPGPWNKKISSPIDSVIIDMILTHYNIQSLEGLKLILTGKDFDEIVEVAEKKYYETIMYDTTQGEA